VTPVNDAPVVTRPANQSNAEGASVSLAIVASDVDGDTLSYSATSLPTGLSINAATGVITGTVAWGAAPSNTVTVTARDQALSSSATFTWAVTHTNRPPVANAATLTTAEDTTATIKLTGSDPDNDAVTFSLVTLPAHGTATLSGSTVTYKPAANYNGADSFTFRTRDASLYSAAATVSITVTPVNDAPVASNGSFTTRSTTPYSGQLTATDVDKNPLTYSIVTMPQKGQITLDSATGKFTYTASVGKGATDTFKFRVFDGSVYSNTATMTVTQK
jgi:VCBS repeat-containing protein